MFLGVSVSLKNVPLKPNFFSGAKLALFNFMLVPSASLEKGLLQWNAEQSLVYDLNRESEKSSRLSADAKKDLAGKEGIGWLTNGNSRRVKIPRDLWANALSVTYMGQCSLTSLMKISPHVYALFNCSINQIQIFEI